jgi:hypothetical protein
MKLLLNYSSLISLLIYISFEIKIIESKNLKINSIQNLNFTLPLANPNVFNNKNYFNTKNQPGIKVNKKNFLDESVWLKTFDETNIKNLNQIKLNTIINNNLKGSIEKTRDLFYKLNLNNINDATIVNNIFNVFKCFI